MKAITRIVHRVVYKMGLEPLFVSIKKYFPWSNKFLPNQSMYGANEVKEVKRNEIIFRLFPKDYMQWHLFTRQSDFSWLKAQEFLSDEGYILDIGANVGAFSLPLARKISQGNFNNCKIQSFEPNPAIFGLLKDNLALNPDLINIVELNAIGLGNKRGTFNMWFNESNSGAARVTDSIQDTVTQIEIITLDEWVEEKKLENIKFIKIDVEGYEPLVLEGARNTIQKYKPALYIEITDHWFRERGYTQQQIFDYLLSENYELFAEINEKFIPLSQIDNKMKDIRQFNLLAVEKKA